MSTLPPIQGIIETRGVEIESGEDETVWRQRLETIYEGLMRANPSYLSISYAAVADEEAVLGGQAQRVQLLLGLALGDLLGCLGDGVE